ncbi:hypothetical protein PN36_17340 [Candidatus Thiomargarita nelsonii]|uniref:Uncharacterized protein n=1 Tax=Candidatus Thiomargarita nelsonii TaxID=1003181 RepID=A0A0A6PC72_9GAMM|nr:hypothetical protein PN36_17340 [Candidatus Thiomargarita nelsonii]
MDYYCSQYYVRNYHKTYLTIGITIVVLGILTANQSVNMIITMATNIKRLNKAIIPNNNNQDYSFLNKQHKTIPKIESQYQKIIV